MATMDTWVEQMIKDMGLTKDIGKGGDANDKVLSDNDIEKVADKVIEKLSSQDNDDISTSKPKNKEPENEKPKNDDLDENETSLD